MEPSDTPTDRATERDGGRQIHELEANLRAVSGRFAVGDAHDRFHVPGLAPNAARISVRSWETVRAQTRLRRGESCFSKEP